MIGSLFIILFVLAYFFIKLLQGFGAEVESQSAFDMLQEELKNKQQRNDNGTKKGE